MAIEKVREKRENEKEEEKLKASPQTLSMIQQKSSQNEENEKVPGYIAAWDLYTTQSQSKLQKSMNWPLLHEEQFSQNIKL